MANNYVFSVGNYNVYLIQGIYYRIPVSASAGILNFTGAISSYTGYPTATDATNGTNPIGATTTPPPGQNHAVTLRSISGVTATFIISANDDVILNTPGFIATPNTISILSDITTASAVTNTINDIGQWLSNNAQGNGVPPPPAPSTTFQVFDIRATDGTIGTFVLLPNDYTTLLGQLFGATISNSGTGNSVSNPQAFGLLTSLSAVQNFLTAHQPIAPNTPNFAYNVQIPNVTTAFRFVSSTSYGTAPQVSVPARSIAEAALKASFPAIPNTLNALYITKVSDADNTIAFATYLSTAFTNVGVNPTPPPSTGTTNKLFGIVAFTTLLAYITPRGRRKRRVTH